MTPADIIAGRATDADVARALGWVAEAPPHMRWIEEAAPDAMFCGESICKPRFTQSIDQCAAEAKRRGWGWDVDAAGYATVTTPVVHRHFSADDPARAFAAALVAAQQETGRE